MYAAVPRITPDRLVESVSVGELAGSPTGASLSNALAKPKSSTFTLPSAVSFTLAGFRSRWMMPFSCAAFQHFGDLPGQRQRFRQRNGTSDDTLASVGPSMYSMTR